MSGTDQPVLELQGVSRSFGGVLAVNNVTQSFRPGEIVGLIGPNGAGKTTLVNLISGFVGVTGGNIVYRGKSIAGTPPFRIARQGIARTFQIVQPFREMSVLENVMAGALYAGELPIKEAEERALECLEFTGLGDYRRHPASELALADRKRLELAKSLAMDPRLLMLDEVNAGLNSSEIDEAIEIIRSIAARGITIIVIEHLMRVVAALAQRVIVMHHGEVVSEGPTEQVFNDPQVIEAYLGDTMARRLN